MKKKRCTTEDIDELVAVFDYIQNFDEMETFMRDLFTEDEVKDFAIRWKAVRMLAAGKSYKQVEHTTGMSSATVARANKWLNNGYGSFKKLIKQINS